MPDIEMFNVGDFVRKTTFPNGWEGELEVVAIKPSDYCPGYNAIAFKGRYRPHTSFYRPDHFALVRRGSGPW